MANFRHQRIQSGIYLSCWLQPSAVWPKRDSRLVIVSKGCLLLLKEIVRKVKCCKYTEHTQEEWKDMKEWRENLLEIWIIIRRELGRNESRYTDGLVQELRGKSKKFLAIAGAHRRCIWGAGKRVHQKPSSRERSLSNECARGEISKPNWMKQQTQKNLPAFKGSQAPRSPYSPLTKKTPFSLSLVRPLPDSCSDNSQKKSEMLPSSHNDDKHAVELFGFYFNWTF